MVNPFSFSNAVDDPAFCNREQEQAERIRMIQSSQNVLLYSHPRFGKTSLILRVFRQVEGITPIYIDLYGTPGIPDFIQAFCYHLWEQETLSATVLDRLERRDIRRRMAEFTYARDPLALNQRRALKLIVATGGKGRCAVDNLARFGFRTPSQATAAIDKLIQREFVVKNGTYRIQDPIFKRWLALHAIG
jgi:hypothetical protein